MNAINQICKYFAGKSWYQELIEMTIGYIIYNFVVHNFTCNKKKKKIVAAFSGLEK